VKHLDKHTSLVYIHNMGVPRDFMHGTEFSGVHDRIILNNYIQRMLAANGKIILKRTIQDGLPKAVLQWSMKHFVM